MSAARWALLAGVAAVVVALTSWWTGAPVSSTDAFVADPVPAAGSPDALSSSWYCPAGAVPGDEPTTHTLVLMNPGGATATARLSGYDAEGEVGERLVEVPAPGPLLVDVQQEFERSGLSVLVESLAGELVVEHRLRAGPSSDQVPCATSASTQWFFPSQSTLEGDTAQLVLFNPFSSDAGVDITVATDDSVLVPSAWQGLVVPAGTVRTIDLGEESDEAGAFGVQRRAQFALTVRSRTGRVVSETVQTLSNENSTGLRMQIGVPEPSDKWVLPQGFVDAGASERLVVYNPGDDPASVAVQVTPYGAASDPPEPFEFDVAPRRYNVIDLGAETRIPTTGLHAMVVETAPSTPVVIGRVVGLVALPEPVEDPAAPVRPNIAAGTTVGTGSPLAATVWLATGLRQPDDVGAAVSVHHPGDGIAVVSAVVIGGDTDGAVLADEVEVASGDSVVIPLVGELGPNPVSVLVESSEPVVVERTITTPGRTDLAMGLAVPLRPSGEPFSFLGARR